MNDTTRKVGRWIDRMLTEDGQLNALRPGAKYKAATLAKRIDEPFDTSQMAYALTQLRDGYHDFPFSVSSVYSSSQNCNMWRFER